MADLFLGQTCTESFRCLSAGAAHTFTFSWQPDKVVFNNLTKWAAVALGKPISVWYRDQTTAANAYQQQVIDSFAASSFNFLQSSTNGFTVADTAGGVGSLRALISAVTQADPCVITTTAAHGFQTNQIVRITDLGIIGPGVTARGMDQLNNKRFLIVVVNSTSFSLKDVITDEAIDSTGFTAWVAGGRCDIATRVISLNNPQVTPYSSSNPYLPDPFAYDPIRYKLTAGTAVMGSPADVFLIEVYKFGSVVNLGQLV